MTTPILVDTSVWVEYLRGTSSTATAFVIEHLGVDLATSEPVLLELLSGAASGGQTDTAERLLLGQVWLHVEPALDYRAAVDIDQAARAAGHPLRSLQDCLLGAVALRRGVALAHRDRDFTFMSDVTGLPVIDLRD